MMKQARSWLVLVVVLTAHVVSCPALQGLDPAKQLGQYPHTLWDRVDGLPFSGVTALTVTSDGYLWLGTQEGLARFDGVRFVVYDKRTNPAFEDHFITSLAPGDAGDLWIGTRRGLLRYRRGIFERFGAAQGLPNEYVRALLRDRAGRLWLGTYGGGLALWRTGSSEGAESAGVERVWAEADGLLHPIVRALHEDASGGLWIGTSAGLHRLDPDAEDPRLVPFTTADGLPSDFIRALEVDAEGTLWVGTQGGGLARRLSDGRFAPAEEPLVRTVGALLLDRDGLLWVGSHGEGLWRVRGGRAESWTAGSDLPNDTVWTLLEDSAGSVWIGTRGGLIHLWEGDVTSITHEQGLTSDDVRTLYQEPDGSLWIGGGGLDLWRDGEILPPPPGLSLSLAAGPGRDEVRTLLRGSDGSLWLGTPRGVKRYDGRGVRTFTTADGLAAGSVNVLAEDATGRLWVGASGGLSRRQDGPGSEVDGARPSFTSWTTADGLPDDSVRALLPDASGGVWIGTESGVARWRQGTIEAPEPLAEIFVLSLYQDADGVLWVGTSGDGLFRWRDPAPASTLDEVSSARRETSLGGTGATRYRMRDGLFNDLIFQILEDDRGGLWMSCNKGLFRVDRAELERFARGETGRVTSIWLDESDGMASAECNGGTQPAGWRARDGRLWFATARGAAVVDPADPLSPRAPPSPLIEEVRVDGEVREPRSPVRVGPGGSSVEIQYTAPSFVAPAKVRFRYRLEGFHKDGRWEEAESRRAAIFTGLPPGDYRFEVTAAHGEGPWHPRGAGLELELVPYFYQTPTFFALMVTLSILVGVVAFRLRVRALRARKEELELLVDRRTHELAEANETLARLAVEDDLTGVPNHRKLQSALQDEWRRGVRSREPLAVLMIDIDHFKRYNDAYGHQQGDRCLRQVARALAECVHRPGDLVARYGGEEFAAVLPRTEGEAARRLAETMRRKVEGLGLEHTGTPDDDGAPGRVTLSVGVTSAVPAPERPPDLFLTKADEALYEAKAAGRNRVVFLAS